ncbi:alpha/beta hydrolase [Dermatophilaceae bacterium Soc4.6]
MSAEAAAATSPVERKRNPRRRAAWRVVLGLPLLLVAGVVTALRFDTIRAGHPAYAVLLAVGALAGVLLLAGALHDLRRGPGLPRRRRGAVVTGRVLAGLLAAVVVGSTVYLVPFPGTSAAIAALAGSGEVAVRDSATTITLTPRAGSASTGLVFQPGARVDPRAYLPLMTRIAASGYLVVVVKQPLDIGFTAIGAPDAIVAAHPEVAHWAVGGHSLGGVAASSYAGGQHPRVTGLLLWASYPLGSLADSGLRVASVSGTRDGLATPADIDASRPDLPADTAYTAVDGGVHAFFGDYGPQPGDGTPTTDRATAQSAIVRASVELLASLARP